jgi:anti-sigma regulatory factor (Ser/Thr protein kinase)
MDASTAPGTVVADFALPSETGNERLAMAKVAESVHACGLSPRRLEALKTAVAEATMNAIEHGNRNDPEIPVLVRVTVVPSAVRVAITDQGGAAAAAAAASPAVPDLDAKLAGLQSPRGWGLFLIRSMVDELSVVTDGSDHTVLLTMRLGDEPGPSTQQEDENAEHV